MSLSYAAFHLVFVFPPLALLVATAESPLAGRERAAPAGLALLAAIALVYTTPWHNHLIAVGVWDYPPGSVLARVWNAPVEEYLFFVLQPLLTGFWLARLPTRSGVSGGLSVLGRAVGVLGGLAVGAAGLLLLGPDSRYYLGTLLVWSGPVLAIQWGFGWQVLWALRRTLALGALAPTAYL